MKRRRNSKLPARSGRPAALQELVPNSRRAFPLLSRGAAALNAGAWQEIRRQLKLSNRELQIIHGIFDDKVEYTIARELGVSVNTIHTESRRLRAKLKVADRVSLVLRIMEEFLRLTVSDASDLPSICRNFAAGRCPLTQALATTAQ